MVVAWVLLQSSLDLDNSGEVSREEFAAVLARDPVCREAFLHMALMRFGMRAAVHRLQVCINHVYHEWAPLE